MAVIDRIAAGVIAPACDDGQHYACEGTLPETHDGCGCGCHLEPISQARPAA